MNHAETLQGIRRAYRYVVAYERRILDGMSVLNTEVIELGFQYWKQELLLPEFPTARGFVWERQAWVQAPLYYARFIWSRGEPPTENRAGNSWLFVDHVADTGIVENTAPTKTEPDPLRHLPSADQCDSRLRGRWLHLGKPAVPGPWRGFDGLVARHFRKPIEDVWPAHPTASPVSQVLEGVTAGGHTISIATIEGPDDFRTRFVDPVMSALRQLPSPPVG